MSKKIVDVEEIKKGLNLGPIVGDGLARLIMYVLRFNKINKKYAEVSELQGLDFLKASLDVLEVKHEVIPEELKRLPQNGPFITVSNHPFGGVDGMILLKLMLETGKDDIKILSNFLIKKVPQIGKYVIAVDPFEGGSHRGSNVVGLKMAYQQLEAGKPLGLFPAGEVSTYYDNIDESRVADKHWQLSMIKFIKNAKVPVVPIYFQGENSRLFHLLGLIHPLLRTAKLPSELLNKKNQTIRVRIGYPISVKEQETFTDIEKYGRFLRLKTYALGSSLDVDKFFNYKLKAEPEPEPIIPPVPQEVIETEVGKLIENYLLFRSKNYAVVCAPSVEMPNLMTEIGRLRELTFRGVGEGTNRKIDVDEFDLYFWQLFIWDEDEKRIVGAYRAGKGKEIVERFGVNGFYIQSLFKIDKRFLPVLEQCIELGRSFVVPDYQRKPLPLFLLWKGILYFLIKNPEYRYLIGPVSISNRFSDFSKGVIISFMKSNYFDHNFARFIKSRNKFNIPINEEDFNIIFDNSNDLAKLDKFIQEVEPFDYRMPVLLKKYVKLNGKIIGFNVDPKFNNSLDGLLILDLFRVPVETITSLSKEINDKSILERFSLTDYTFEDQEAEE
ncbi:MAG: lysophospholipid acyltransferase family protein [Bacteroidales bacterium]|nr:lysophospholipid acyltransferase family protein [Bacteroidales bacterium]HPD94281.1 lysophospholipid acyltransferase family protein [Tenuifilaceae bacterium]HRX30329.1 lysophospholipid acyltransferase family protein [Tenuifilaceae bacterium]